VKLEIKIPSVGESVTQGIISSWLKKDGESVEEGSDLLELETDKATVTVPAPATGVVSITVAAGTEVAIGQVIGFIDTEAKAAAAPRPEPAPAPAAAPKPAEKPAPQAAAKPVEKPAPAPKPVEKPAAPVVSAPAEPRAPVVSAPASPPPPKPVAAPARATVPAIFEPGAPATRESMSSLRKRIAQKLLEAQHATASLTTFNEVNMQNVMDLRSRYREEFERRHGVKLGFMSFFVKACCRALAEFPVVNARIDGDEIVSYHTYDIGVAVSTDRGLVVPVVRNADRLSIAELEAAIADLAARARDRRILPDELAGGTFSITNGGVFGSLLSTPLLNYPQSAILGMHSIQRRPIVEDGNNY
jgi:2-oxoglutarate dehydrogenase E2 component (dihydrolipoamide succinyltransferase)